jgi:hypothetical protein
MTDLITPSGLTLSIWSRRRCSIRLSRIEYYYLSRILRIILWVHLRLLFVSFFILIIFMTLFLPFSSLARLFSSLCFKFSCRNFLSILQLLLLHVFFKFFLIFVEMIISHELKNVLLFFLLSQIVHSQHFYSYLWLRILSTILCQSLFF